MKTMNGCAIAAAVGVIVIAASAVITLGFGNSGGAGLWFIQGTFDRVNPLADQATAYAQAPAPDAYFDSYEDATGSGENYVYAIRACDENGVEHKANLISFGGKLGEGSKGSAASCLKLDIKGGYVRRWEWIAPDAVPSSAAQALG